MPLESLLLTALFSLTAVAFIGVLNARGLWRTSVAAGLALLCLGAALWRTTEYRAARHTGMVFTGALAPGALSPGEAGADEVAAQPDGFNDMSDVMNLLAEARALRDSMALEEPARARSLPDSEYQAFEGRAATHLARARMLRERAARLAAAPPSSALEEAAESLNLALQSLNGAARDLQAFFRAPGREEEQRLTNSFRAGVEAADTPLRRAESRAGASEAFEASEASDASDERGDGF
jgi:hypothetical protein